MMAHPFLFSHLKVYSQLCQNCKKGVVMTLFCTIPDIVIHIISSPLYPQISWETAALHDANKFVIILQKKQ